MNRKPLIAMTTDLLGRRVPNDQALAELSKSGEQQVLFDNKLTAEQARARKLAKQHKDSGGKELFE